MLFCVKTPINKLYAFGMALLLAVTLAGCGGGGMTTTPVDPTPPPTCDPPQILNDAMDDCVDPPGPPPRDMATPAMIMAKAMGIMALDPDPDASPAKAFGAAAAPFDGAADAANTYSVSVEWADGAAMATVTDVGADGAVDGPAATDTTQDDEALMMSSDMPHAIDGWIGSIHTKDMEKVTVYTDIMAATPTAFAMVSGQALDANPATDGGSDFQSLGITAGDTGNHGMLKNLAGVSSSAAGTLTYTGGAAATTGENPTPAVPAFSTSATFNSAQGTLSCNAGEGATCSVTFAADGSIGDVSAGWIFTPDEGAMSPVADADHLRFGFWVKPPAEGEDAYSIQTFAGGSMAYTGTLTSVTGNASYMGKAAGVYAQKTMYNPDTGDLEGGHVGAFTADVNLMAYFGTSADVAVNDQQTLSGTVSNFMDGENMIDESWSLKLNRTKFDTGAAPFEGTTSGGGDDGAWTFSFFGPGAGDPAPTGVAGEFTGHFSRGHVAGAYGATKVME